MASVEVFVDDAVHGNLPYLCAKTGRAADGVQRIEQKIGAPSAWLALLVLVPWIGWAILIVVLATSFGRPTLTVRVPTSRRALAVQQHWRHWWLASTGVAVMFAVAAITLALGMPRFTWIVLAVAAFAVSMAAYAAMLASFVRVRLDASRRWVTLTGIDPRFRDAVLAQRRGSTEPHSV